jgi:protein TonB
MAYADQGMSTRKVVAIAIVALLHVVIGYAFITGLAINVIKKAATDLKVVDIKDQPPPPEQKPPPPPPEQKVEPPPIVVPPSIVPTQTIAPPVFTQPVAPPIHVEAPPAPPPPPRPTISQAAGAKGDPAQWITNDDYPPAAMREGRQGTTRISWTINTAGRVENCQVTSSSGSPDLDQAACTLLARRGRYSPAKDQNGQPISSTSSRSIRWQIPKD